MPKDQITNGQKFGAEEQVRVCSLYVRGSSITRLATEFHCDRETISRILARHAVERHAPGHSADHRDKRRKLPAETTLLAAQGRDSAAQIAEAFGVTKTTVEHRLRQEGVPRPSPTTHGRSHDKAYTYWLWLKQNSREKNVPFGAVWWERVECFYDEVGERPSPHHQLRRRQPDLGYVPGNVYWLEVIKRPRGDP